MNNDFLLITKLMLDWLLNVKEKMKILSAFLYMNQEPSGLKK